MTIEDGQGFQKGLRIIAQANILLSCVMLGYFRPRLSTPLFEFPLLATLHLFVLGGILPLLMERWCPFSRTFRLAVLFFLSGTAVLVAGFLLYPRSPLPLEGGLLVSSGLLLVLLSIPRESPSFLSWVFFWIASLLGISLGGVLARPVVDPIPFSAISVHAILGAGLGLYALCWIGRSFGRSLFREGALLLATALGLFLVLRHTLVDRTMVVFSLGALGILLAEIRWAGRILALVLAGGVSAAGIAGLLLPGTWVSDLAAVFVLGGLAGLLPTVSRRSPRRRNAEVRKP